MAIARRLSILAAAVTALGPVGSAATAQQQQRTYAEYRVDIIAARTTSAQAGGGVEIPLDVYTRLGLIAAAGVTARGGAWHASGRVDVLARYLLDPFREVPWGLSLGGGVTIPYVDGDTRIRPYLTLVVDLEGPRRKGWSPAFQLGLGGGARLGLVMRASTPQWR